MTCFDKDKDQRGRERGGERKVKRNLFRRLHYIVFKYEVRIFSGMNECDYYFKGAYHFEKLHFCRLILSRTGDINRNQRTQL